MTSPTAPRTASAPEQIHALFKEALEAADLDGMLALYEPNAAIVNNDGSTQVGLDAIRAMLQPFIGLKARIDFHSIVVHQAGEIALVHAKWSGVGTSPEGPVEFAGTTSEVLRRQPDGRWLYLVDDPGFGVTAP
jgi:uncharacterized protein (TIGR02246 family)